MYNIVLCTHLQLNCSPHAFRLENQQFKLYPLWDQEQKLDFYDQVTKLDCEGSEERSDMVEWLKPKKRLHLTV